MGKMHGEHLNHSFSGFSECKQSKAVVFGEDKQGLVGGVDMHSFVLAKKG